MHSQVSLVQALTSPSTKNRARQPDPAGAQVPDYVSPTKQLSRHDPFEDQAKRDPVPGGCYR
jgi:hypothetical protein